MPENPSTSSQQLRVGIDSENFLSNLQIIKLSKCGINLLHQFSSETIFHVTIIIKKQWKWEKNIFEMENFNPFATLRWFLIWKKNRIKRKKIKMNRKRFIFFLKFLLAFFYFSYSNVCKRNHAKIYSHSICSSTHLKTPSFQHQLSFKIWFFLWKLFIAKVPIHWFLLLWLSEEHMLPWIYICM